MINSKKVSGVFAIWLLLFAMFGPLASVSAVEKCYGGKTKCAELDQKRVDAGLPGCVFDTYHWNECLSKSNEIRLCSECGKGILSGCGEAECKYVIGEARDKQGLIGCDYDSDRKDKCYEVEGALNSKAEKIEENGGKCFGPNKLTCLTCGKTDDDKVECQISGFQLPQHPKTTWKDVGGWFKGVGDPSYLVYYEAFPDGEELAWQIPGNEALIFALIVNGVFSFLPGMGKVAGEVVEVGAKEAAKDTLEVFGKELLEDSIERAVEKKAATKLGTKVIQTLKNGFRHYVTKGSNLNSIPADKFDDALLAMLKNTPGVTDFPSAFKHVGVTDKLALLYTSIIKNNMKSTIKTANFQAKYLPKFMKNKALMTSAKDAVILYENNPEMKAYAINLYDLIDGDLVGSEQDQWWDVLAKTAIAGPKPDRHLLKNKAFFTLFAVSYSTAWTDSISGKFVPRGIDDMVLKMPYYPTQELTMAESHKYYVELVRDSGVAGGKWFAQDPQRFFMASPCYADIKVSFEERTCSWIGKSNKDCMDDDCGDVLPEDKQFEFCTDPAFKDDLSNCPVMEMNKIVPPDDVDAKSIMPGAYFSEDYQAAKMCATTNWYEWVGKDKGLFFNESHKTPAVPTIRLQPMLDGNKKNNFCFAGNHIWQKALKGVIFVAQIPLSIGAGITAGPIGIMAVGTVAAFVDHGVGKTEYWPSH